MDMGSNEPEETDSVSVSMELSGRYEDVVSKLENSDRTRPGLQNVFADFEKLLDTVETIDGGTKSVIVENLPDDMAVTYDSDAVVNALQVLEGYDLVTLDGNTWKIP